MNVQDVSKFDKLRVVIEGKKRMKNYHRTCVRKPCIITKIEGVRPKFPFINNKKKLKYIILKYLIDIVIFVVNLVIRKKRGKSFHYGRQEYAFYAPYFGLRFLVYKALLLGHSGLPELFMAL